MNFRSKQLLTLLSMLRAAEEALPEYALPTVEIGPVYARPWDEHAISIFRKGQNRITNINMEVFWPQAEESLILAIGLLEHSTGATHASWSDPAPSLILGVADCLCEDIEDLRSFVQPRDPGQGFILGTLAPFDETHIDTQFCWGSTNSQDPDRRGYMDGTPTPSALREAFDLPERFPPQEHPPERRMTVEAFISCCRRLIRLQPWERPDLD